MKEKKLIIVESPTKSKTIKKILKKINPSFDVIASYGHIRDLAKNKLSLEIKENQILPIYVVPKSKRKIVSELKKKVKKYSEVILATDQDREGEAIAWHLVELLNLKNYLRITFHEITEETIKKALLNPRKINLSLVNAQQSRRILDRIVGYLISPLLWKKITRGLSAGRVQSAALRMIVEREREIENFIPQSYYEVIIKVEKEGKEFEAKLFEINGEKLEKFSLSEEKLEKMMIEIEKSVFVEKIKTSITKRSPNPPFVTSTMTSEAWKKFKFPAKLTMSLAQNLYEEGLITYMRTDSTSLAQEAIEKIRNYIKENFPNSLPEKEKIYKTKSRLAQEAHEAIRPTDIFLSPEKTKLQKNHLKLYEMIWRRTVACQMKEALFEKKEIILSSNGYKFKALGQKMIFPGFTLIEKINFKEEILPELKENEKLIIKDVKIEKHLTEPPPRYNDGSLIKTLESYGIGRPSTYATIISTLLQRGYVIRNKNKNLVPTELGMLVNDLLLEHFPLILDYEFTAKMEEKLDLIAQEKLDWQEVLVDFYFPFLEIVKKKTEEIEKIETKIGRNCPLCGGELIEKFSKYGKFIACSNFPKCQYKESKTTGILCPKCQTGFLVKKKNKKNQIFYACSNWPECDFTTNQIESSTNNDSK